MYNTSITNEEKIKQFRLFDDAFMKKCFENHNECIELVLRIILNKPDLKVVQSATEYVIQNLQGRSVRFDVKAVDSNNNHYDCEVQRADIGASRKRARYNSSVMDANALDAGDDIELLPESYVIFITENDVIGLGLAVYTIDRSINETSEPFGDGSHIVYVNGSYRDDSPIGKLMHDFSCEKAEEMFYSELSNRVGELKNTCGGEEDMGSVVDEIRNEEREVNAVIMLLDGELSYEKIAKYTRLPIEHIMELDAKKNTFFVNE